MDEVPTKETCVTTSDEGGGILVDFDGVNGPVFPLSCIGELPVVAGLRPKQVRAAMMLVEGRMAKEVAHYLRVSPETVSRWRAQPAFQLLMRDLLQESIDATKLGLVSLFSESIVHLRGMMNALDEETVFKAINLLFSKASPVLTAVSGEVQRRPIVDCRERRSRRRRPVQLIARSGDGELQQQPASV